MVTQDAGDVDPVETLARAELDRVARDLVAHRESVRGDPVDGSLAARVAARDAQLWAAIDSPNSAHE